MVFAGLIRGADRALMDSLGQRYVRLARDPLIHERCSFVAERIGALDGDKMRVLDIGCGAGFVLLYLDRGLPGRIDHYQGIDLATERLAFRYRHVRTAHDFTDVDLDTDWNFGTWDVITCLEVIEHLQADERLMTRMADHLKPHGNLILTTPSRSFVTAMAAHVPGFDSVSHIQDGGHVRTGYTVEELTAMAERNGLAVDHVFGISRFAPAELVAYLRRTSLPATFAKSLFAPRPRSRWYAADDGEPDMVRQFWSIGLVLRRMG